MPCRLCASKNFKQLFNVNHYTIVKCQNCALIYTLETPTEDEFKDIYSDKFFKKGKYETEKLSFSQLQECQRRKNILNQVITLKNAKMLDFGCAYGDFVNYMSDTYDVYGTDFSVQALHSAKTKYPSLSDKFILLDQIEDKKFDLIMLCDVIEHVPDPVKTIQTLKKSLNPGGYIFISTPNTDTLAFHLFGKSWAFMIPPEHLSFFGSSTLNKLLDLENLTLYKRINKGKWVNMSFFAYKLKRAFPQIIPDFLMHFFQNGFLKNLNLYIPTGDIQYVIAKMKN